MDFQCAMDKMEEGCIINRPEWIGYLFLDADGKVKHAGNKNGIEEISWMIDTTKDDWEVCVTEKDKETISKEKETSRIETMLDETSSHIKRLYYLEEMIHSQHIAMKRIVEETVREIEDNRKHLQQILTFIPKFSESLSVIKEYKSNTDKKLNDIKRFMDTHVENKMNAKEAKEAKENKKTENKKTDSFSKIVISDEEKKEMEEVRKKMKIKNK